MKKTTFIKNAQIVTENGIIWDGALIIEDGVIAQIGYERDIEAPSGAEIIDANGAYVGPGFIDIHVHGGGTFETYINPCEAAEYFLAHGETTILATTAYHNPLDELVGFIKCARENIKKTKNMRGLYLEGPFINSEYGSSSDINPWRDVITPDVFKVFVDAAGKDAKVWTIAAEREGILPFVKYAREVNPDVVFALGHTEATPAQIRALGKYKPTIQTHSMNATGRLPVPRGTRACGPDEYAFKEIDMYTELISDSCGIHVNSEMQQLLLHTKGVRRVILITDSTTNDGQSPEKFSHITDLNFDHNGDLAGSKLTMDKACKNIMYHTNCGIAQAFVMAASNPARAIGMDDERGSIEVGKKADLVFVDDKFNVKRVLVEGEICV